MILLVFREEGQWHLSPAHQLKQRHIPAASGLPRKRKDGQSPRSCHPFHPTAWPVHCAQPHCLAQPPLTNQAPLMPVLGLAGLQMDQPRSASQKLIAAHLKGNCEPCSH